MGFDCSTCDQHGRKEERGCGVKPIYDDHQGVPQEWDAEAFLDAIEDGTPDKIIRKHATATWWLADIGHAIDITGSPWPYCPAYFARFMDGPFVADVDRAIKGAKWTRKGAAWVAYGMNAPALTPRDARLMNVAWNALDAVKADTEKRLLQESQKDDA